MIAWFLERSNGFLRSGVVMSQRRLVSARTAHGVEYLVLYEEGGGEGYATGSMRRLVAYKTRHPLSQPTRPLGRNVRSCQTSVGVPLRTSTKSAWGDRQGRKEREGDIRRSSLVERGTKP